MKDGYKVEYDNEDQICIIPSPFIPLNDAMLLAQLYNSLGYKYWLPADKRKGFIFSKKCKTKEEGMG